MYCTVSIKKKSHLRRDSLWWGEGHLFFTGFRGPLARCTQGLPARWPPDDAPKTAETGKCALERGHPAAAKALKRRQKKSDDGFTFLLPHRLDAQQRDRHKRRVSLAIRDSASVATVSFPLYLCIFHFVFFLSSLGSSSSLQIPPLGLPSYQALFTLEPFPFLSDTHFLESIPHMTTR